MAISIIDICNRALDLAEEPNIMSLDDGLDLAGLCSRNYGWVRDAVLRSYPWNSVLRRASLPSLVDSPIFGYANQFQLPEGPDPAYCLRVWRINGEPYTEIGWHREGMRILTDEPAPLNIHYIARIEDPNQYDILLCETIALSLATTIILNRKADKSRYQLLMAQYKDVIQQAKRTDSIEGSDYPVVTDRFTTSRF